MTAFKFNGSSSRYATGLFEDAFKIGEGSNGADSLTIEQDGYLISNTGDGATLDIAGPWTVNVQGFVISRAGLLNAGIRLDGGATNALSVTVGAGGGIQ